ncbi:hypothetical protein KI387_037287, partial [Taxus chinensis]
ANEVPPTHSLTRACHHIILHALHYTTLENAKRRPFSCVATVNEKHKIKEERKRNGGETALGLPFLYCERERMEKICIREFDAERDTERVEELERRCEVGPSRGVSLYTDLMGDPICRIRHTPAYTMLVAEDETTERNIVGLIRGSIKTVVCGIKKQEPELIPLYTKAAYILGLRVSPTHRRKGIGLRLVEELEKWFKTKEADYAYMATEKDNDACIKLF